MAYNLFNPGDKVVCTNSGYEGCKTGGVYTVKSPAGMACMELEEFEDRWFLRSHFRLATLEESTTMKPSLDLTKPFTLAGAPNLEVTFLSDKGPSQSPLVFKVKADHGEYITCRSLDGSIPGYTILRITNKVGRTSKFANIYANSSFTRNLSFVLHGTKELADKYHEARRIAVLEAIYEDGEWVDVVLHKVDGS